MIPLPSLLVLECDPSVRGRVAANDRALEGTSRNGTVARNHQRNRRRWMEPNNLPPTPPAPLRLRRIRKIKPPQYQDVEGDRAPFWERQQLEEEQNRCPQKHTVASIKRHTQLFAFLVTLASFVAVDEYTLLPTGTILYAIALSIAWENWTDECEENLRYLEKLRQYREKMESIEREVQKAQFEYHVLRNQPHVDIIALRRTKKGTNPNQPPEFGPDFDPNEDQWIIYADEKKQRPAAAKQRQRYNGPHRYQRAHFGTSQQARVGPESNHFKRKVP